MKAIFILALAAMGYAANTIVGSNILDTQNISFMHSNKQNNVEIELTETQKQYVAHAGGMLDNKTYTNCYEAIDNSYKRGFRLIEIDVEWTSDDKPILAHSWDGFINAFFNMPEGIYSFNEFKKFKMINGWHQLTLDEALNLLENKYKDAFFITDTKNDNIKLLNYIKANHPNVMFRIIPQVYTQEQYHKAKEIGYDDIIYTLYLSDDNKNQVAEFCNNNKVFAITMDTVRASSDLPTMLKQSGTYTYVHTINTYADKEKFIKNGINGIYTDVLFD